MKRFLLAMATLSALVATGVCYYFCGNTKPSFASQPSAVTGRGAYTLLQIARQPHHGKTPATFNKEEFDLFRTSQKGFIKTQLVLSSALREPKVAALPLIKDRKDPVAWLEENLIIDFPDSPEILRIALRGDDTAALVAIVNAVADAYLKEVVYKEANIRSGRLVKLKKLYSDYDQRLQQRQNAYNTLENKSAEQGWRMQNAKDLLKELPRLQLAEINAHERLKHATGKENEELTLELTVLVAQQKMISERAKELDQFNKDQVILDWMRDEVAKDKAIAKTVSAQISALEIELWAPQRIAVLQHALPMKGH